MKQTCTSVLAKKRKCSQPVAPGYAHCFKHLKEYYSSLPRKRMAAGILLFNAKNDLLILKPTYKEGWSIPGGVIDKNESPYGALVREVKEELDLSLAHIRLLSIDYLSPTKSQYSTKDENIQFIFYGGTLDSKQISRIRLPDEELSQFAFVPIAKAIRLLGGNLARRIPPSLKALKNKTVYYLEAGEIIS